MLRYCFYYEGKVVLEDRYDVDDYVRENGCKSLSFGDEGKICKMVFGTSFSGYELLPDNEKSAYIKNKNKGWMIYEEDGICIGLDDVGLAQIRNYRLESIGINEK